MEKESDKHPQEAIEAAWTLISMKNAKLDDETASILRKLKSRVLEIANNSSELPQMNVDEETAATAVVDQLPLPPRFPPVPSLVGIIGECSIPFTKDLTESDTKSDQSRLVMSKYDVDKFLMPLLKPTDNDLRHGIRVTTFDIHGKAYPMVLKVWSFRTYVLTSGWKAFCTEKGLTESRDSVTVWMFRRLDNDKVCFVVDNRVLPLSQQNMMRNKKKNRKSRTRKNSIDRQ